MGSWSRLEEGHQGGSSATEHAGMGSLRMGPVHYYGTEHAGMGFPLLMPAAGMGVVRQTGRW